MPNEFKIKNGFFSEGNSNITGSLNVSAGITGSLLGTASFALAVAGGGGGGGVTQIIAGTNVSISPAGGTGAVTINSSGAGGSFPFSGSAQITGSLGVTGSINGVFIGRGGGNVTSSLAIGQFALNANTNTTGSNIAIGHRALQSGSGFRNNVAIGDRAGARLCNNLTPTDNVFIGCAAGYGANTGTTTLAQALQGNIAIGKKAGYSLASRFCYTSTYIGSYYGGYTRTTNGFSTTINNVLIGLMLVCVCLDTKDIYLTVILV